MTALRNQQKIGEKKERWRASILCVLSTALCSSVSVCNTDWSLVGAPFTYGSLPLGGGAGDDAGVEELVPRVGQARQAPVDAVGVRLGVGLLLRREQLPLPERVHRRVRVLAELRQRRDVHEVHRHAPERLEHVLGARVEAPVRAHVQRRAPVGDRQRLHCALDAALVAPCLRPVLLT